MKFKDLNEASSFLEMASRLIELKTKHLLPFDEDETRESDEDTEIDLQDRLLEYDLFKRVAEALHQDAGSGIIRSSAIWQRLQGEYIDHKRPMTGDPYTLLVLYEQLLSSLSERRPTVVIAIQDNLTIDMVIESLLLRLEKTNLFEFQQLYQNFTSRYELVANLIGILQLSRDRKVMLEQDLYEMPFFSPLWIRLHDLTNEQAP